jgi:hypothetical protein
MRCYDQVMKLQARKHVLSDACLQRTFFIHYIQSGEGITPGVAGVLFSSDHRENDPGLGHAVFFLPWRRFTSLHFDRSSSRYVSVFGERKGLFFLCGGFWTWRAESFRRGLWAFHPRCLPCRVVSAFWIGWFSRRRRRN